MDFPPHTQPDLAPADMPQLGFPRTEYHHPLTQRAHGLYGSDGIFTITQQAHLPDERFATAQNHTPHQVSLSTGLPRHVQYDAELARIWPSEPGSVKSAASAAPVVPAVPKAPMAPLAQPRKRKAPILRADDWEPYKARIIELHITQNHPLGKVKEIVKEEFGFIAE